MKERNKKLAESLEVLHHLLAEGDVAIHLSRISKTHRERLVHAGFLTKVTKYWFLLTDPSIRQGDTTSWYISYWPFCAQYLSDKFGKNYCLSAEQSLLIHAGDRTVSNQLIIRSPKGTNKTIPLLYDTSMYILKSPLNPTVEKHIETGLQIMTKEAALVYSSPVVYKQNATEVRVVLASIQDTSALLKILLEGGHSAKAGRLAGALRNIGQSKMADEIVGTMTIAGYKIRETDPFLTATPKELNILERSPYANRIRLRWLEMRNPILDLFPNKPKTSNKLEDHIAAIKEIYVMDAYHSLSIEKYAVTKELIERVKSGQWVFDKNKDQRDAMAARGYWDASQLVLATITDILKGKNAGLAFGDDFGTWYRALFAPSVTAGIIKASDLAGFRNTQVYISNSMHTPMNSRAVRDAMPALIEMLTQEPDAIVRAILGHFFFVYIHPYVDGNGRMARFLMNTMLASGGYSWVIIPVEQRTRYMNALEEASVKGNLIPFTRFIAELVE